MAKAVWNITFVLSAEVAKEHVFNNWKGNVLVFSWITKEVNSNIISNSKVEPIYPWEIYIDVIADLGTLSDPPEAVINYNNYKHLSL